MVRRISQKAGLPFGTRNWRMFFFGLGVILIGYIFLSIPPAQGVFSLTLAPILLVAGYCIVIPVAILLRDRRESETRSTKRRAQKD